MVCVVLAVACVAAATPGSVDPPPMLDALIVGGGPNPESNQVAIESNVRYLLRLLPANGRYTVLFADGDPTSKNVLYETKPLDEASAERLVSLILKGRSGVSSGELKFRAPQISKLDGASKKADISAAFDKMRSNLSDSPRPLLLYFTGHGSATRGNLDNNVYDLWENTLSVRELAGHVAALPPSVPVTLVMVQCYSGAFGNLIFEGGDPTANPIDRPIAGFFATVRERMAAGCTPEVDEREYHDFTSYFFSALTGQDRLGRKVTGADYNRDGRVGMNEAYAYALINDRSIDTPTCTSDVFLRRYVKVPVDTAIFETAYSEVHKWAQPAQAAVLDRLSATLNLSGEDRGKTAYSRFIGDGESRGNSTGSARRAWVQALESAQRTLYSRWPDLRNPESSAFKGAREEAIATIRRADGGPFRFEELRKAEKDMDSAEWADYEKEMADARLIRFVRQFKTVVLAHHLNESGEDATKRRYARLIQDESRSIIPRPGSTPESDSR